MDCRQRRTRAIRKLNQDNISKFLAFLLKKADPKPCSLNTARGYLVCLRAVIRFCYNKGVRVANPDTIIVPKREKLKPLYLKEGQVAHFLETVECPRRGYSELNRVRNALIVRFLFDTGLRISELCALNRNSIVDRHFVVKGKSKNLHPCFISESLERQIANYIDMRTDNNPALFVNGQNGERIKPGTVRLVFRRACQQSGFSGVHPHTLRHSFGTRMVNHGVDIVYVAELMGHESLDVTRLYTHLENAELRSAYNRVIK